MFRGFIQSLFIMGCAGFFTIATAIHPSELSNYSSSGILAQNNATASKNATADKRVGIVVSVKGKNLIKRGEGTEVLAAPRTNIMLGDELKTSNEGYLQVTFKDGSILKLVGKGSMLVNDFLFDEEKGVAGGELTTEGSTFIFMSGKISKIAPQNFKVKTATATIGIRGSTIDMTVAPNGEMKITGEGIFADPKAGGGRIDFNHGEAPKAFMISHKGIKSIPVPKEGGFFKQQATAIYGSEVDEVVGSEDEESEEEDELGATMEEENSEEEKNDFKDFLDLSSLYGAINDFDLDENRDSSQGVEGFSGRFFDRNRLFVAKLIGQLLVDKNDGRDYSSISLQTKSYGASLDQASFFAYTDANYSLGYFGKEIESAKLPSNGIINFTSAMNLQRPNGGSDFPLSVLSPDNQELFVGENDVFVDLYNNQVFGSITLDSQSSNSQGVYGLEGNEGQLAFNSHLDIPLPNAPTALFFTGHGQLEEGTSSELNVAANLGFGVVNGEFLGASQASLLGLSEFEGGAQIYGQNDIEGIGIYASAADEEGALVAASFTENNISQKGPSQMKSYTGLARGIQLNFSPTGNYTGYQRVDGEQLSFSADLNAKQLQQNSLLFDLDNNNSLSFTPDTSFVMSQELVFSALSSSNLNSSQSFILANPVPIVNDSQNNAIKTPGILWGSYNLVNNSATQVNPGQMNFFVAAQATPDSYFLSGPSVKAERKATPFAIYKGASQRTIVDPNLFDQRFDQIANSDELPFFTDQGYSSVLVNYEDEIFEHYSVFPDGFLVVGSGNLESVDLNGANAGGSQFGLNGDQWRVINLGPHSHSELFEKGSLSDSSTDFPNSEFIGGFASDEAESLFFSYQREHTASGGVDQSVYGVGVAAKVSESTIADNPVITTGYVHGVLVNKASGQIIADIAEDGKSFAIGKQWENDTDPGNIQDLDVVLHALDALQPAFGQVTATNTVTASSEERGVLNLYSDYDSGNANSTLERYAAEIDNTNAKLKDISFSYTFNAKNVLDKISQANGGATTNATNNTLPLRVYLYAQDGAGKYYVLATEAKTYTLSEFDEWITEDFDFTTGDVTAIQLTNINDLEDHTTIETYLSGQGLVAAPLSTWLSQGNADPIANDAEVFKVIVKWGEAAHTNEDTDTDTMFFSLDNFTIKDANDDVIFHDDFEAVPVADSLFIDKDAFYLPFDATSQSVFTPDISGYTKVAGKTVISALPGLEDYEYLVWGIWSSEMTEDANPSNHVEAFGFFGGGMIEELSNPSGYASFAAANQVVNYTGKALGNIFDLSTSRGKFVTGTSSLNVNFSTGNVTSGKIEMGGATIQLQGTTLNNLIKGLPFNGSAQLGIDGQNPSGTGTYQGQFFGNGSNYAKEASGSFSTTNSTHKAVGAFGVKRN